MPHTSPLFGGYHVRENGLWLSDTTAGDVTTARHGFVPKAPNDTNKLLRGDATWAVPNISAVTFTGVRVHRSSDKSISHNTETMVDFDTEQFDSDAFHSTVTNTTRITVPSGKAGYYTINACAVFAANATGVRNVAIRLNGASTYIGSQHVPGNSSSGLAMFCGGQYYLGVGDYIEMSVYQNSGGNLNLATGNYHTPALSMVLTGI